jgi:hypothetical protein
MIEIIYGSIITWNEANPQLILLVTLAKSQGSVISFLFLDSGFRRNDYEITPPLRLLACG